MFPRYPYLDLSDRNLDSLTEAIREMQDEVKNFVSLNAVKYANPIQWSINRQYEKNTIVIDPLTGTAFISVQPVPRGVALTRTQYWTPVFDLSRFVTKAASNFANSYERDITTTATMPTGAGDWVVWDSTLYVALNAIHAGDAYVVGGNIKRMTIEDFYDLLMQAIHSLDEELDTEIRNRTNADTTLQGNIDAEARARGEADTALQGNIDAEVRARSEADSTLQGNINAEALARQQADGTLQGNIDAEATTRENVDRDLNTAITYTNNRINTQVLFKVKDREFLICGDSYNDESGEWGDIVKSNLDISSDKWHDMSQGGAGFVSNGQVLFIDQISGYTGNRNTITDIIVCGGANDSTNSIINDGWWTVLRNNMIAFNDYVKENYPYATVSLGFIAGSLDWGEGGVVYGRTYKARELCRYYYENIASSLGWNVLHNVNLALCTNMTNISSDKLHPSSIGSYEIGNAITQAYLTGYADILRPPTNACLDGVLLGNAQFQYEIDNEKTTLHINSDFYLAFNDGTTINNAMIIAYTSNIGFNIPYNTTALARLDNFDNIQYQFIPCRLLFTENSVYIDLQSSNLTHSVTAGNTGYLRLADIDIEIPTKIIP